MCGWPHSLLDWDLLFLLPLPWWGPVLAPVSIALLMIMWGTVVSSWQIERARNGSEWKAWVLNFLGVVLALYVFMADSIRVAPGGVDALRNLLPQRFNWPLFCVALALTAAPVVETIGRLGGGNRKKTPDILEGDSEYGANRGGERTDLEPVKVLIEQGE
jgi:uncharacterized integral membrane protein